MKKHKIIEFIGFLNDGGAETLVKDYCLLVDKEKIDISVVTIFPSFENANNQILIDNNIRVIPLYKKRNLFTKIINKFFRFITIKKLKKILSIEKPKTIHIHLANLKFLSVLFKDLKNVRLLYTCHSLPKVFFTGKNKKEFIAAKKLINKNNLQLIALHDDMKNELNQMFDVNNTVVIRNGINFNRFLNVAVSKEQEREVLSIPKNAFVVGHNGRFVESKNHKFLLNLFCELLKTKPESFLLLIGSGPLEEEVKSRILELGIKDKVLILSHRKDIPELLKAMDVFVFPSNFEGLGIVLIEAQVAGLKCIASTAVPKAAFITENAIRLDLNEPIDNWVNAILNDGIKGEVFANFDDYDMNVEIKKLEKLYLGE